ncbi:MAG: serine hydrolase domain-containing protein [Acidobacteriota bacterium]|nr:serine hydrolase domain-containing protein [Acidobacteriota bacterium]
MNLRAALRGALCSTAFLALVAVPLHGETVPPARFEDAGRRAKLAAAFPEVEEIFAEAVEKQHMPGAAMGIVVDGELVFTKGLGVRDVAANASVDADTVFRIASMTKSFTAVAILKLRDEGKLGLDDPVSKYVPELASLAKATGDASPLTIRHLLSHSEGFPEDNPWGDRQLSVSDETFARWLKAGIPFSNAPGVAFEYSNTGFAILGRIVARASGMRYRDYVDRNVLRPLGMTSTWWDTASVPRDRLAKGYRREGDAWVEEPGLGDGAYGSMGGLYSTVRDLARYTSFFLSAWPPRDGPETGPIRRSSAREMQQVARFVGGAATRDTVESPLRMTAGGYDYGLGTSQTCRFRFVVSHAGGLPGYGSTMRWLPEHGVAIVALGNLTYARWGSPANEMFEGLNRTGALKARVPQPSTALLSAQAGLNKLLLETWSDAVADGLAADNLFLDTPKEKRKASFEELRARHGACAFDGTIEAENALRGAWKLACDRGSIRVEITLAPTMPPRVQHLETTSALPLSESLAFAADGLATPAAWGPCRRGEVLRGGGETNAVVRFDCTRGRLDADLVFDKENSRLTSAKLSPAKGETCVP